MIPRELHGKLLLNRVWLRNLEKGLKQLFGLLMIKDELWADRDAICTNEMHNAITVIS